MKRVARLKRLAIAARSAVTRTGTRLRFQHRYAEALVDAGVRKTSKAEIISVCGMDPPGHRSRQGYAKLQAPVGKRGEAARPAPHYVPTARIINRAGICSLKPGQHAKLLAYRPFALELTDMRSAAPHQECHGGGGQQAESASASGAVGGGRVSEWRTTRQACGPAEREQTDP